MNKKWLEEEVNYLLNNYDTITYRDISKKLGRTLSSVKSKARSLDLKLSKDQLHERRGVHFRERNKLNLGENNPNWKGGISKNHYHYKKLQVERYPERVKARKLVGRAIESGKLVRKPCLICGKKEVQGHHEDYSKPLDIIWICKKHHDMYHRGEIGLIKSV